MADGYGADMSQEYAVAKIMDSLPKDLSRELRAYIDTCGALDLGKLNAALEGSGQLRQLVILAEYSVLQFGVLLTVLKEQDLVLAKDAKDAVGMVAGILRTLSGHMELLLAPEIKH